MKRTIYDCSVEAHNIFENVVAKILQIDESYDTLRPGYVSGKVTLMERPQEKEFRQLGMQLLSVGHDDRNEDINQLARQLDKMANAIQSSTREKDDELGADLDVSIHDYNHGKEIEAIALKTVAACLPLCLSESTVAQIVEIALKKIAIQQSGPTVTEFVPKRYHAYLNSGIDGFFRGDRILHNMALRMSRDDVLYVGQLISLDPETVRRRYLCGRQDYLDHLSANLLRVGLTLGQSTVGWAAPLKGLAAS